LQIRALPGIQPVALGRDPVEAQSAEHGNIIAGSEVCVT
jgi:hypothetical protein